MTHSCNAESKQAPPKWDEVPFDVTCARCGHDLRGLSQPKCPSCALVFDWADAIPLEELTCLHCGYHLYGLRENRCPECGEVFAWDVVLRDYRARQRPVFEYHWRTRPIRSFFASFRLAFRPWKLWRTVQLHDPPAVGGVSLLLTVVILGLILFTLALAGSLALIVETYATGFTVFSEVIGSVVWPMIDVFVGWAGGFGALLVLRQSMSRCRVRFPHVYRAYVYALFPLGAGLVFFVILLLLQLGLMSFGYYGYVIVISRSMTVALVIAWIGTIVSVALAYRLYMKMRHAWAIAIATQLVAGLVGVCFSLIRAGFYPWGNN